MSGRYYIPCKKTQKSHFIGSTGLIEVTHSMEFADNFSFHHEDWVYCKSRR